MKVDEELRTKEGIQTVCDLRREKPPKKPAILNILGESNKDPGSKDKDPLDG